MRIFAVLVIAACASPPAPVETSVARSPDPWDVRTPPLQLPAYENTVALSIPTPIIEGPTRTEVPIDPTPGPRIASIANVIEMIAVTADGNAAVTGDAARSLRLWPTLDGKREPLVLSMRTPAMLAIARDADAFVIAGVDSAGQLELARATTTAEITQRFEIGLGRPIVEIHATSLGFVALRDDRVVTLIGLDGVMHAELTPEPGEYLTTLAVRDDRALAIIERDDRIYGRWVELASGAWGEDTPALPITGEHVVLSPSHERIAGPRRRGEDAPVSIVSLTNGKVVGTIPPAPDPIFGDFMHPVGFLDERKVAVTNGRQAWWNRDGTGDGSPGSVFGVANGLLIGGSESVISISTPGKAVEYVGYRMSFMSELRPTKTGYVATDGRTMVELDAKFHTRAGYALSDLKPGITGSVVLVDDTHAIGLSYNENRSLYLISTQTSKTTLIAKDVGVFGYEPTTRLLHYAADNRVWVTRFDTKENAFGFTVEVPAKPGEVVLLDPAEAKRNEVAILVRSSTDLTYHAKFGTVDPYAFVTTSERVITPTQKWWNEDGDIRTLVRAERQRAKSPDRSLTAELREGQLVLREGKTVRWTVPNVAGQLAWTPRGELFVFGSGLAHVDLATGALRDRQCGAWFGRWKKWPEGHASSFLCEGP